MEHTYAGKPQLIKQANLSLIRKFIKKRFTATRAEIAKETEISSTTVRSLLAEMLENGEIESIGHDDSSGGRKAERYRFVPDRYYGAVYCITGNDVHALTVNVCGEIVNTEKLNVIDKELEKAVTSHLDRLVPEKEIKSVGIGVPGVVEGNGFWRQSKDDGELYKLEIGGHIEEQYGIPVIMENDLNATALGFKLCYEAEFECKDSESSNMVYINFEKGCVSAGIIAGGKIIRGSNNFAGELGFIPVDGDKCLDECMSEDLSDAEYVNLVVKTAGWICGILNPRYIAFGGEDFRKDCLGPIADGLFAFLPGKMNAEVLYAPDIWHDYYNGMAYLASENMFDEVCFGKERPCR